MDSVSPPTPGARGSDHYQCAGLSVPTRINHFREINELRGCFIYYPLITRQLHLSSSPPVRCFNNDVNFFATIGFTPR